MMASSTCTTSAVCNLDILSARCTGFTKLHSDSDYTYIVDLEWSDDRCHSIKRTFGEFQSLHLDLLRLFPELRQHDRTSLRTNLRDSFKSFFTKDKKALAEWRESILDKYLSHLLRQPERIRQSGIVLNFFEARITDPRPWKCSAPSEKSDSGIDLSLDNKHAVINNNSPPYEKAEELRESVVGVSDLYESDKVCSLTSSCDSASIDSYDENCNEDYFLDVGFGELMLGKPKDGEVENFTDNSAESLWCSNLDRFSNILKSSISNIHAAAELDATTASKLNVIKDEESCGSSAGSDHDNETSETESQLDGKSDVAVLADDDAASEDSQIVSKISKSHMKHYYLSTSDLSLLD